MEKKDTFHIRLCVFSLAYSKHKESASTIPNAESIYGLDSLSMLGGIIYAENGYEKFFWEKSSPESQTICPD